MSDDILRRTDEYTPVVSLRLDDTDGDGRTVIGCAVPYDQPATINERGRTYTETFKFGAFTRTLAERGDRVKFLVNHDRLEGLIGKAVELWEEPAGLMGRFRISDTAKGNDVLNLIRDGAIDAFSIGFVPVDHRGDYSTVVERTEVKLMEVSAVGFPAYDGATIAGVRQTSGTETDDTADHGVGAADHGDPDPYPGLSPAQRAHQLRALDLRRIR